MEGRSPETVRARAQLCPARGSAERRQSPVTTLFFHPHRICFRPRVLGKSTASPQLFAGPFFYSKHPLFWALAPRQGGFSSPHTDQQLGQTSPALPRTCVLSPSTLRRPLEGRADPSDARPGDSPSLLLKPHKPSGVPTTGWARTQTGNGLGPVQREGSPWEPVVLDVAVPPPRDCHGSKTPCVS